MPVSDDSATEEISETGLTPLPDGPEDEPAPVPSRPPRSSQKTVVDMQLPAGLLEMFGEPSHESSGDDTAELSVDVDVSDAERPSVPPAELEPLLDIDPGDRPTPPPQQVAGTAPFDPADRPTPLPRLPVTPLPPPPPFGAVAPRSTPAPIAGSPPPPPPPPAAPVSTAGVVVMAPIRSVGEPARVAIAEPTPSPEPSPEAAVPEPLLKPQRHPTKHGVGPAVPPHVDGLDWSGGAAAALPFDGALPGEPGADGAARPPLPTEGEDEELLDGEERDEDDERDEDEDEAQDEDEREDEDEGEDEDEDEDLAREPTQVRRTREDGTPGDVAAKTPAVVTPPSTTPLPRPATPAPVAPIPSAPPVPLPATGATTPPPAEASFAAPAGLPGPTFHEVDAEAPREERDSDPGTPIDVEAEVLTRSEPPPPPGRTPSGPRMPAAAPPPPPGAMPLAAPATPPPAPAVSLLGGPVISAPPPVPADARPETGERRRKGKKWWEDFFNEEWLRTIPPVPAETTRKECDFIESSLGVEHAASILDLGCGTGRHAVELASRGYSVVALDLSLCMLEHAQSAADDRGAKVTFQQADIRDLSFESSFDAVYCTGTTLGLFDEEGNLQVIKNACRALRENGTLLIEVVNRDHVLEGQPNLLWFEGEGCVCMEETNVNYITSRLQVKRTVMPDEGGQTETEYSVRLYSRHERGSLRHKNGWRVLEVSGHWATRGVFFGAHSQRLLVLAEKRPAGEPNVPTGTQPGSGGKAET